MIYRTIADRYQRPNDKQRNKYNGITSYCPVACNDSEASGGKHETHVWRTYFESTAVLRSELGLKLSSTTIIIIQLRR